MGSDKLGYNPSSTPKLSLFSSPSKLHESPAGMLTPPIHTLASVPFKWEEAPGKPRPSCMTPSDKPKIARCLELPPRLLNEAKVSNMPSPTTVMDGPFAPRSLSLGKGSSFTRWGCYKKNNKQVVDPCHGGETKVKITRKSSFLDFSHTGSHLWTNICENLEHVVSRGRR